MDTDVEIDGLKGRLLIASPAMTDPRFERSVILVCAHSSRHAMGIVINKPLEDLRLGHLFDQLGIDLDGEAPELPVLAGGPVERERGFVLHSDDFHSEDATVTVAPGLALTATRDVLEAIGRGEGPRRAALALGYAGWGAGQLEQELQDNAWIVGEPTTAILFGDSHDVKWTAALGAIGVAADRLSGASGRA